MSQVQADLIGEATQQGRSEQKSQGASQRSTRTCGIASPTCRPDRKTDRQRIKKGVPSHVNRGSFLTVITTEVLERNQRFLPVLSF
jgi:hypothetical protein